MQRVFWSFCLVGAAQGASAPPSFEVVESLDHPVIGKKDGVPLGIFSGFEGGLYMRTEEDGVYHLFPSEAIHDDKRLPWDVHMQSHHWTSPDGIHNWTRREMIYESSANYNGTDRRSSIWAPMPLWDKEDKRWNLFYVGYTCGPHTASQGFAGQVDGAIFRMRSETPGRSGLAGPYPADKATMIINMQGAGGAAQDWEGGLPHGQGDDSFFAWQLPNATWAAFYGSHKRFDEDPPQWKVGLAVAEKLAGPWRRLGPTFNPASYIESPMTLENPIVTRTTDGEWFIAVYDTLRHKGRAGVTYSADGLHWSAGQYVDLRAKNSGCGNTRTPQGLVPEPQRCRGCYSLLYTGSDGHYDNECWVLLRNRAEAADAAWIV